MQKEEVQQRETDAENAVVPIFNIGDYVTCQFKRIGGSKYNGTVTHLYTTRRADELEVQLGEASSKLLKIFQMVDKRLISRIQAIEAAVKKKKEEITPQMENKDDSITLRLRNLEPELESQRAALLAEEESEAQLSQTLAEVKGLVAKKTLAVEECKAEQPINKKKLKKLNGGLKKATKQLNSVTVRQTETFALIVQYREKLELQERVKTSLIANFSAPRQVFSLV